MEYILETEFSVNQYELVHLNNFEIENNSKHLFFVEPLIRKSRKGLPDGAVDEIQQDAQKIKDENDECEVISIVQFPKNKDRSLDAVERAMRSSFFNGSAGACLYETRPKQNIKSFTQELDEFSSACGDRKKYFVLEMESNEVVKKLLILLSKGIKNIIFVAGNYSNFDLWKNLPALVRAEKGTSILMCIQRMQPRTKKSYLERAVTFGFDVVFHGVVRPFIDKQKKAEIVARYLDRSDMTYKIKAGLSKDNVLFNDEHLITLSKAIAPKSKVELQFSRVCSINEGRIFCLDNRRKVVVQT